MAMSGDRAYQRAKQYTKKAIAEAQLGGGGEVNLSEYTKRTELEAYAKKDELPPRYDDTELSNRVTDVEESVATLNGNGDGSVGKTVDNALNEFASKISNDGVVNTYKELVDYAAEHSADIVEMAGDIADNANDIDAVDARLATVETNLGGHTVGADVPENAKFTDTTYTNAKLGQGQATCSTAAATTAKTVSLSNYTLTKDGVVMIKFTNAVPANATLNINSKGAKPIYYNGSAITSGIINAGDIALLMYDGTNYELKGILFTVDGLVEKLGIGNENSHVDGVTSKLAFWRNDAEGTRFECVASKANNNYITDSITIYTTLTNNQFPSLIIGYDVTPGLDNEGDLGSLKKRWCNIYGVTGAISTSDRNKKKDIENLDVDKTIDFIMGLNPVRYKFIDGQSGRTHWGLVSQDVEKLLGRLGMDSKDFAGFIKSPKITEDGTIIEGEYEYALRYGEFIAPLIKTVQNQQQQIAELKAIVEELRYK